MLQVYLHLRERYAFDVGSPTPPRGKCTQSVAYTGTERACPLAAMTVSNSAAVFSRPAFLGCAPAGNRTLSRALLARALNQLKLLC